jgi:hypothetical protein
MQVGTYLKLSVAVAVATILMKGGAWAATGSGLTVDPQAPGARPWAAPAAQPW